jgi:hypothetical protein
MGGLTKLMKLYICSTNFADKITPNFSFVLPNLHILLENQTHNIPFDLKPQADEAMSIKMRLLYVRYVLALSICVTSKAYQLFKL